MRKKLRFQEGEIATIIALGSMVFILVTTLVSNLLITKKPQTTLTRATPSCINSSDRIYSGPGTSESACWTVCSKYGVSYTNRFDFSNNNQTVNCCCGSSSSSNTPTPTKTSSSSSLPGCCTMSDLCGAYSCKAGEKYVKRYPAVTNCTGAYTNCPTNVDWHLGGNTEGCAVSSACGGSGGCTLTEQPCPSGTGTYNAIKKGTGTTASYDYYPSSNTSCSGDSYTSADSACGANISTQTVCPWYCVQSPTSCTKVGTNAQSLWCRENTNDGDYCCEKLVATSTPSKNTPTPTSSQQTNLCTEAGGQCKYLSCNSISGYIEDTYRTQSCKKFPIYYNDAVCCMPTNKEEPTSTPTPTPPVLTGANEDQICKDQYGSAAYCQDTLFTCGNPGDKMTDTICNNLITTRYCCIPDTIISTGFCYSSRDRAYYKIGDSVCSDQSSYIVCQNKSLLGPIGALPEWSQPIACSNCVKASFGKVKCGSSTDYKCIYNNIKYNSGDRICNSDNTYIQCLSTTLWSSPINCPYCKQKGSTTECVSEGDGDCYTKTGNNNSYCDRIGGCLNNYDLYKDKQGYEVKCGSGLLPGRCCIPKAGFSPTAFIESTFTSQSQGVNLNTGKNGGVINIPGFGISFIEGI